MRKHIKSMILVPAAVVAVAACGGDEPRVDDALRNDLALASQMQGYQPQQFVSPAEMGYANGYAPYGQQYAPVPQQYQAGAYYNPAPAPAPVRTVYRTAPAASRSSGTVAAPTRTREVVKKNTKRDAIIGAAAGAAIGAVTSKDKLKGAVIGGAAGGLLGAVIGNNVDVKRTRVPF